MKHLKKEVLEERRRKSRFYQIQFLKRHHSNEKKFNDDVDVYLKT